MCWRLWPLHTHFLKFVYIYKITGWGFIGIALNLSIKLGRTDILAILSLLSMNVSSLSTHLAVLSFFQPSFVVSSCTSCTYFVRFTLKCFHFEAALINVCCIVLLISVPRVRCWRAQEKSGFSELALHPAPSL